MITLSTTLFPDGLHFPTSSPTPLLTTIVAFLTLAFLGGIAYVFQPALASYRRPLDPEPYSFPKYPTPSSSSSSSSSPTRRSTRTATKTQQNTHTEAEEEPFPTLADPPTFLLSLVIPAYNEQDRLPIMLDATLSYLHTWQTKFTTTTKKALTYELIIVDDGSTDKTAQVTHTYSQKYGSDTIRLLKLRHNRGKGGALREGMLHTRGRCR
jgi:cellulose synthase/poly-beta-1,6-N-acetylglucosamine synthase-like glycosyltransferase